MTRHAQVVIGATYHEDITEPVEKTLEFTQAGTAWPGKESRWIAARGRLDNHPGGLFIKPRTAARLRGGCEALRPTVDRYRRLIGQQAARH